MLGGSVEVWTKTFYMFIEGQSHFGMPRGAKMSLGLNRTYGDRWNCFHLVHKRRKCTQNPQPKEKEIECSSFKIKHYLQSCNTCVNNNDIMCNKTHMGPTLDTKSIESKNNSNKIGLCAQSRNNHTRIYNRDNQEGSNVIRFGLVRGYVFLQQ